MHKIQNSGNIFTTDAAPISTRSAIQVTGLVPRVCCTYMCIRCRVLYRLALPLTPIMTTHDSTPVIDEETTQRSIVRVGCQFMEYRGQGKPNMGQPPAKPGDVYFIVKEQLYTVWVCQSDYAWNQWVSMADSMKCKHPEQEWILYPSVQRLVWVPISGYDAYLRQTTLRLGKWKDSANTHIKIMLDQERGLKPVPPPIKEASPERAPSPDDSSDNEAVQPVSLGSDVVHNDPTKTEAALMAERHAVLENRSGIMRMKVEEIQKAVATCSGAWYLYYL